MIPKFPIVVSDPSNSRAATNVIAFEIEAAKLNSSEQVDRNKHKQQEIDSSWLPRQPQSGLQDVNYWVERDRYKKLCRGDRVSTVRMQTRTLDFLWGVGVEKVE